MTKIKLKSKKRKVKKPIMNEQKLKRDEIGTNQLLNENDINNIMKIENIIYDKKIYNKFKKNLNEQKKSQKYGGDPIIKVKLKKQSQFLYDELKNTIFKSDKKIKQTKQTKQTKKPISEFDQNLQKQMEGNIKKQLNKKQQQEQRKEILKPRTQMPDYEKLFKYDMMDYQFKEDRERQNAIAPKQISKKPIASKQITKKKIIALKKEIQNKQRTQSSYTSSNQPINNFNSSGNQDQQRLINLLNDDIRERGINYNTNTISAHEQHMFNSVFLPDSDNVVLPDSLLIPNSFN